MEMVSNFNVALPIKVPRPMLQDLILRLQGYQNIPAIADMENASTESLVSCFLEQFKTLDFDSQHSFAQRECSWLPPGASLETILRQQPIQEYSENWSFIDSATDYRVEAAYKSGGMSLLDQAVVSKIRSVGTEVLKQVGKKIISGDFNLTHISFPIRCMQASTALHNTLNSFQMIPLYLSRAASLQDHLERMKLIIVSVLSSFLYTSTFEKPLNPILGETLFGELEDGTRMFAEQTSHHPPVSHFYVDGNGYRVFGYFNYTASAGFNSVTVTNIGKKIFEFPDGYQIVVTCPEEVFSGTFLGTMRHESLGNMKVTDNDGNTCAITLGKVKRRPSDYLQGSIQSPAGKSLAKLEGTYLGYLEWNGVRYWDARFVRPYSIKYMQVLHSDSENRKDICVLRNGNVELAQRAKEELEDLQRVDRKFREKFHK